MKASEIVAKLGKKGSRVFARVPFGPSLFKSVELTKKDVVAILKKADGDIECGARVAKSGHIYFYGLSKAESDEQGFSWKDAMADLEETGKSEAASA